MPKVSERGLQMPESPIRKLMPYAEAAKKRGIEIIHLNIGQPDIETPTSALEAVKNFDQKTLKYTSSQGSEIFRKKIGDYFATHEVKLHSNDIIVTTGASEALLFAFGSTLNHGDEIIIPEPFYANYKSFAIASGVKIVPVCSTIETDFALPPIEAFEQLISAKTKAILICNPNNPTGYVYSQEEIKKLATIVKKHNLYLIADEVYREFIYEGQQPFSILNNFGLEDHGIIVDSFSKRYSMCGARIGCLISKNKEIISTALKFAQARLSPPTYAQVACEAALETPKTYFDNVIKEYEERRTLLVNELSTIPEIVVAKPKGAFYCMVQLPIDDAEKFSKWLLTDFTFNGKTLMLAPAAGFYESKNAGLNQVRIAYVLKKEMIINAVALLKQALKKYNS
jgi:aspartate aminotransferase